MHWEKVAELPLNKINQDTFIAMLDGKVLPRKGQETIISHEETLFKSGMNKIDEESGRRLKVEEEVAAAGMYRQQE